MVRFTPSGFRNHWMRVSHRKGEPSAARLAAVAECYPGIIAYVQGMNPGQRKRVLRGFFEPFPNGKKLGSLAAELASVDFGKPAPIQRLVGSITAHLEGLDRPPAVAAEFVSGELPLVGDWADSYRDFQLRMRRPAGEVAVFLHRVINLLGMGTASRDLVLELAWGTAEGDVSAWGHLGEIVLLGWEPMGLAEDGSFLVRRGGGL